MKKVIGVLAAVMIIFTLFGCGRQAVNQTDTTTAETTIESAQLTNNETTNENSAKGGKALVAYFTWSGNTKEMADYIAEQTGADVFEITPVDPYPTDYGKTGDIAKKERDENARPEINNLPSSLDEYDTILIGYPIWWHTAPMIVGTFLENYDLSGKDVYPFTQSASMDTEQFNNSMEFVKKSAKGATVHDGLFVDSSDTDGISAYLIANGLTK